MLRLQAFLLTLCDLVHSECCSQPLVYSSFIAPVIVAVLVIVLCTCMLSLSWFL